jgi:hypothetical protein
VLIVNYRDMFYAGGGKNFYQTSAPYDAGPFKWPKAPESRPKGSQSAGGLPAGMNNFDIWPVPGFVARTDLVNGAGPASDSWHVKAETLPKDPTSWFYQTRDFAPKFLNSDNGYTIITPLNSMPRSAPYNFTLSYLLMSKPKDSKAAPWHSFDNHNAFRVHDGAMSLQVEGYGDAVQMLPGDVAFLPKGTKYKYHAIVPATTTLYISAGGKGLDAVLLEKSKAWTASSWPQDFAKP